MGVVSVVLKVIAAVLALIALVIVIAIVLVLTEANPNNALVEFFGSLSQSFGGPTDNLFTPAGEKKNIALNYGVAAVIYLVLAGIASAVANRLGSDIKGKG